MYIGQAGLQCWVILFLSAAAFFSADFAGGLLYCLIFVSNGSGVKYIDLFGVFLVSLVSDICSFGFIGATFAPAAMFHILSCKMKAIFRNFTDDFMRLLTLLLCCRVFFFLLLELSGRNFNISSNRRQIMWSLLLYAIFCLRQAFHGKAILRV
jgi:hypothetical protein